MRKPPSSVRSIRLRDDLWAWIAEDAEKRGLNANALVAELVERLRAENLKPADFRPTIERKAALDLPLGPQRVVPGSRLKKR
jgi:hypothetical protein